MKYAILIGFLIWSSTSFTSYQDATAFLNTLPDDEATAAKVVPDANDFVVIYPTENPCCTGHVNDWQCHQVPCTHRAPKK